MDTVDISVSEFSRASKAHVNDKLSIVENIVYSFFTEYPNQNQLYQVEGMEVVDSELARELKEFGILLNYEISINLEDRKRLLIVNKRITDPDFSLAEMLAKSGIPTDITPTHYVLDIPIRSVEELREYNELLSSHYANIRLVGTYNEIQYKKAREEISIRMEKEVRDLGLVPVYIDENVQAVTKAYQANRNVVKTFLEEVDKINRAVVECGGKPILMCISNNSSLDSISSVMCSYIFYTKGINSHLQLSVTRRYLNQVSEMFFNPRRMLVEEQFAYILNLPDICSSFSTVRDSEYFVYLDRTQMKARASLVLVDAEDISNSDPQRVEVAIQDLVVIPLESEVNLNVSNSHYFNENHKVLLGKFSEFETVYPNAKRVMDVTNTFFLEWDGVKKLAHVENIDFNIPAVYFPINVHLTKFKKNLDYGSLSNLFPINVLEEFQAAFAPHILSVRHAIQRTMGNNAPPVKLNINFKKTNRPLGIVVKELGTNGTNLLDVTSINDPVLLGLWWNETYVYRISLNDRLSEYIDVKKSRKYSEFFSVFGGPFQANYKALEIREEFTRELV